MEFGAQGDCRRQIHLQHLFGWQMAAFRLFIYFVWSYLASRQVCGQFLFRGFLSVSTFKHTPTCCAEPCLLGVVVTTRACIGTFWPAHCIIELIQVSLRVCLCMCQVGVCQVFVLDSWSMGLCIKCIFVAIAQMLCEICDQRPFTAKACSCLCLGCTVYSN